MHPRPDVWRAPDRSTGPAPRSPAKEPLLVDLDQITPAVPLIGVAALARPPGSHGPLVFLRSPPDFCHPPAPRYRPSSCRRSRPGAVSARIDVSLGLLRRGVEAAFMARYPNRSCRVRERVGRCRTSARAAVPLAGWSPGSRCRSAGRLEHAVHAGGADGRDTP